MEKKWWKEAVAYQIYVRSFKDSNGDGIGDLGGIMEKLDYIKSLGVDTIYLNPINKSPNKDNGYDISDFKDIMDEFGTLEDFRMLLKEIHSRDMKLVLDLVINHTSDEHPWFKEARKSKDNYYRDYYIWQNGKDGEAPNNWGSFFGGSAWEYTEETGEYYLHIFSKEQPDLNWENEKLRNDIKEMIKFWIAEGVDGFRMDAINHLGKDPAFPDGDVTEGNVYGNFISYVQNLPQVHDYLKELRRDVFEPNHVVIGETGGIDYTNAHIYTGLDREELDFTFHFDFHSLGKGEKDWERAPINLVRDIKNKMTGWATMPEEEGWCPIFYSNHDTTRTVSRLGSEELLRESATMLATMQMTQKGTPFIYNGDEIGMTNASDFKLEDYRDVAVFNKYKDFVQSGIIKEEDYLLGLKYTSRDNTRTPMQWNEEVNSGFSTNTPWIRVNSNYKEINVEKQNEDSNSIVNYYRDIISLRKNNPVFIYGDFRELDNEHKSVYSYIRALENEKVLVICNFFGEETEYILPKNEDFKLSELLICNYEQAQAIEEGKKIVLRPYEARVYKI